MRKLSRQIPIEVVDRIIAKEDRDEQAGGPGRR